MTDGILKKREAYAAKRIISEQMNLLEPFTQRSVL